MSSKPKTGLLTPLLAPLNGRAIPLDQVPDDVFSRKLLGNGIAIIPSDGKIYAPADGKIASVAETLHAYCFTSEAGLEILVHVGLESVTLRGEGFQSHVQEGDTVKAGQLVAEFDLELLKRKGIPIVTPVLICEGAEGESMSTFTGNVTAGKTEVITLGKEAAVSDSKTPPAPRQNRPHLPDRRL